jgi:hypothetical protein
VEEIQAAPALDLRIVCGMLAGHAGMGESTSRHEIHGNRELPF